jgi:hypothetical protein
MGIGEAWVIGIIDVVDGSSCILSEFIFIRFLSLSGFSFKLGTYVSI